MSAFRSKASSQTQPWSERSTWRKRRNKLLKIIDLPPQGKALDLSSADGQFLALVHQRAPSLHLYGVDISEKDIQNAKKNYAWGTFSTANADATHFPDKSFDLIFCNMAFHHYKNPIPVLNELKRILKPRGKIYLMDVFPQNSFLQIFYNWMGCDADYHFEKYYTSTELENLSTHAGLKIKEFKPLTHLPKLMVATLGIL